MLEKQLDELNIFALRELARRTGVSSPTSKKKSELISEIVAISSGQMQPSVQKTKQGRPPKGFGFVDNFNSASFSNILTLQQDVKSYKAEELTTVAGYIEKVNNNSALLWVQNDLKYTCYFIPSEVVGNLNLKSGDKIVAEVGGEEQTIVQDIYNINGTPLKKFSNERNDYISVEHNPQNKACEFESSLYTDLALKIGQNTYIYGANNTTNTNVIVDMINNCNVDHKIYINVSVAEKNKVLLKSLKNAEMFTAFITDEIDQTRRMLNLAIERAKRLFENGKSVLVAIDDVSSIKGVDKEDLSLTKNLVSLTKEGNNGSITIFAIMPVDEKINSIEKLADKRIKLSATEIINLD